MNKREAKMMVYRSVAAHMSASTNDEIIVNIDDYDEADQERLYAALEEVQIELQRKANRRR